MKEYYENATTPKKSVLYGSQFLSPTIEFQKETHRKGEKSKRGEFFIDSMVDFRVQTDSK